jgi:hypothetical protein
LGLALIVPVSSVALDVHTPLMQVVHTPFIHLLDTELLPEVPVEVVHSPFTHVVITHVPLSHDVLCLTAITVRTKIFLNIIRRKPSNNE